MNRQEFNTLEISEQIQFVNNALAKGDSLRIISTNLNMSKTTIRDRFKKIGYVFNAKERQYKKDTNDNSVSEKIEHNHNTKVLHNKQINNKTIANNYKNNIDLFDTSTKNKILDIVNNYDNLIKMINWYSKQKDIIESSNLKIDRNKFTGEIKVTTIRIYEDVWKSFKKFSEEFKEYKNQDLLSQALLEFLYKYKK